MNKIYKAMMILTVGGMLVTPLAQAEGNPFDDVKPTDWDYKSITRLVDHGVITDTKGLRLGARSYTRYELTPLVVQAYDKRDGLNESDKEITNRLYNAYADAVMNYKIDQDKDKDKDKKEQAGMGVVPSPSSTKIDGDPSTQQKPTKGDSEIEPKMMTQEEIDAKMRQFKIDDSLWRMNLPTSPTIQVGPEKKTK